MTHLSRFGFSAKTGGIHREFRQGICLIEIALNRHRERRWHLLNQAIDAGGSHRFMRRIFPSVARAGLRAKRIVVLHCASDNGNYERSGLTYLASSDRPTDTKPCAFILKLLHLQELGEIRSKSDPTAHSERPANACNSTAGVPTAVRKSYPLESKRSKGRTIVSLAAPTHA